MHLTGTPGLSVPEHLQQVFSDRNGLAGSLGEGGMATVFRARVRKHADRRVALEILRTLSAPLGNRGGVRAY